MQRVGGLGRSLRSAGSVSRAQFASFALSEQWRDAGCMLLLLGFALAVVSPILAGKVPVALDTLHLWGPQGAYHPMPVNNPVLADSALIYYPWEVFTRRSLAGGEWPLWDPAVFAGYPHQSNPQTQLYYPVSWLLWLLPIGYALQVSAVFHIWLAGVGAFVLARVLGVSRWGSIISGLAFASSGQFLLMVDLPGTFDIYPWLPWVVAAAEIAWRRRSWGWTAAAGLLFGVLALSGHLQWFIYSTIFLTAWLGARVLLLAWQTARGTGAGTSVGTSMRQDWRGWFGQTARSIAIVGWGVALSAVQVLPLVEMSRLSSRGAGGAPPVAYDPAIESLRLLIPRFFGYTVGEQAGSPMVFNNCWYVGLAPLGLALLAPFVSFSRRTLFLGVCMALSFFAAAGIPPFDLMQRLPGFQGLLPQRIAYLFIFSAVLLAGFGFDGLVRLAKQRPPFVALAGGILAALSLPAILVFFNLYTATTEDKPLHALRSDALRQAAIIGALIVGWWVLLIFARRLFPGQRWRYAPLLVGTCLVAITMYDLLTYVPGFNTYSSPADLQVHSPPADFMLADKTPWRQIAPSDPPMFVPETNLLYGFQDVQGYDSLHMARYEKFWAATDPKISQQDYFNVMLRPQKYTSHQADLLNVKYVSLWSSLSILGQVSTEKYLGELSEPITQTFRAPERLTSIEFGVDPLGRVNHAPITLHLRRVPTDTVDLLTQTLDPASLTGSGPRWIKFSFQPLPTHEGDPMVAVIESPGAREGDSVQALASIDDKYPDGQLIYKGKPQRRDLAFVAKGELPPHLRLAFDNTVTVYTNEAALPRVFTVAGSQLMPPDDMPTAIAQPDFNPMRAVLIEQQPPAQFADLPLSTQPPGSASITNYRNLSVDAEVKMDRPGWLVLGDVNYPGWNVQVDGKDAPLYQAYYIIRAVPLPQGTHHVHFYFQPMSVIIGGAISLGSALLAGAVLLAAYLRGRRRRREVAA